MDAGRRFQAKMETDLRQFGDAAVVSGFYTLLWTRWFGCPADLFSFCQIFKVAHYQDIGQFEFRLRVSRSRKFKLT
jgi:hypothetical protein